MTNKNTPDENYARPLRSEKDTAELKKSLKFETKAEKNFRVVFYPFAQ